MKTMEKLCQRFNRENAGAYKATMNTIESYKGCYRVIIENLSFCISHEYIFTSCKDFSEWIAGVVLD